MNISLLAVLIPIIWGAVFLWLLRRPRNVARALTPEEIKAHQIKIASDISVFYAIRFTEALRMVALAMQDAAKSTRTLKEKLDALEIKEGGLSE